MFKRSNLVAVIAAAGLFVVPHASAQVKGYVGGGLGLNTVAADVVAVEPGNPDEKSTSGKSNFTGQIEGGVRFETASLVFGVGLYMNPLTLKADEVNDNAGFSIETEVKDLKGLVGELGWKLGSATVAYGKLTYNQARVEAKVTDAAVSATLTKTFSGIGFGAGFRQSLTKSVYLFADWHHIMGGEESIDISGITGNAGETRKIKPTLTTGLVGAGWTFP